jgi:mRNA deadenylase 3'-5' endonuclease subunit Ccr4
MGCTSSNTLNTETVTLVKREFLEKDDPENSFTVLTWNVLHQELTNSFPRSDPCHLTWEYRLPLIKQQLQQKEWSIICLQEMSQAMHADIYAHLADLGYEGVIKMKGEKGDNFMGSSIYWLKSQFEGNQQEFKASCYTEENGSAMT